MPPGARPPPGQRPWHRALITERAARFYLAHGLDQTGYDLLAQARQDYAAWGATAKVAQLDWAYPALRPEPDATADDGGGRPGSLRRAAPRSPRAPSTCLASCPRRRR